jgi:NAD(P)-dependent dehydrogenase (short-subunit alcohol dehydrogenase family)
MEDILSKFRINGAVTIVTGGGSGIGRAISKYCAMAGAQVIIADNEEVTGEKVAWEINACGGNSLSFSTDVTNSEQVSRLVEYTINRFGRIDILVNNVGGAGQLVPMVNISDEEWNKYIVINLTSVFIVSKAVGRIMIDQNKGNIINISSIAGTRAVPGLSCYAAAKAGVINFTKSVSIELARYNIRVNCIIPGAIDTGFGVSLRGTAEERAKRAGIPLGRTGNPEDVALAAIYLASDASSYITGSCIEVRGGPLTRMGDLDMFIERFPNL